MRPVLAVCVLAACGERSPVVGTWRLTGSVIVRPPSGAARKTFTDDFEISRAAWLIGGGCAAPLTFRGVAADLRDAEVQCVLQSLDGVPFVELGDTRAGDTVLVNRARFVAPAGRLDMELNLLVYADPRRPDAGIAFELKTNPDAGAERVR